MWNLEKNPAGFFADEASVGYDALQIIKNGTDRHGKPYPLFFAGFNYDNVSPYQVYLTVPFVKIFGLNETAVRLTSVFFSSIELIVFFLLLNEFVPFQIATIGTLLLSISPWYFHISRINMGDYYSWTLLTATSYLFLIKGMKKRSIKWLGLAAFFFGLTTYSYTPARLITPLLFGLTLFFTFLEIKSVKKILIVLFIYILMLIPFINFHLTDPHSFQRVKDTMGIDINQKKDVELTQKISLQAFIDKYLMHFSNTFLFEKGDADFPGQFIRRHSISGLGELYPYQSIFIIMGIGWCFWKLINKKRVQYVFPLIILILYPLADSLTLERTPYATRSYLGVLPFHILIAFGIYSLISLFKLIGLWKIMIIKTVLYLCLSYLILTSLNKLQIKFLANPNTTSDFWGWQYGPREIMKYFLTVSADYDDLYISGEYNGGQIFLPFYDPQNKCQSKCKMGDFFRAPIIVNLKKKQLFALSPYYLEHSEYNNRFTVKKTLYYPNNSTAFFIGEIKPE